MFFGISGKVVLQKVLKTFTLKTLIKHVTF